MIKGNMVLGLPSNICVFIKTTIKLGGLNVLVGLPPPPGTPSLIRTIELSNKENLLASE
jgi:hypothetical protein